MMIGTLSNQTIEQWVLAVHRFQCKGPDTRWGNVKLCCTFGRLTFLFVSLCVCVCLSACLSLCMHSASGNRWAQCLPCCGRHLLGVLRMGSPHHPDAHGKQEKRCGVHSQDSRCSCQISGASHWLTPHKAHQCVWMTEFLIKWARPRAAHFFVAFARMCSQMFCQALMCWEIWKEHLPVVLSEPQFFVEKAYHGGHRLVFVGPQSRWKLQTDSSQPTAGRCGGGCATSNRNSFLL